MDHRKWLAVLEDRLAARKQDGDRLGIETLAAYYGGRPRPPMGADKAKEAWQAFQAMCRTNYCLPVVEAVIDRLQTTAVLTAAADDENGDADAWAFWVANDMTAREGQLYRMAGVMRDSYAMVNDPRWGDHGQAVVTIEDPRWTITDHDPLTGHVRAALKIANDQTTKTSTAWVMVRGEGGQGCQVRQFIRPWSQALRVGGDWTEDGQPVVLPFPDVPVVRYTCNPDATLEGTAEHEPAIDIVDRINSGILLRLVVAFNQAFRRTAFRKANESAAELEYDTELIDPANPDGGVREKAIDEIFENSPAAIWDLPVGWDVWESAFTDLTPLLTAEKTDLAHLAAVTRTPMDYLVPDGANQSAEGANLKRENLLARAKSRQRGYGRSNARLVRLAFLWKGDTERANLLTIEPQWQPAEQYSLSERYSAASQGKAAGVPWGTLMRQVLQFTPSDVGRMEKERDADLLYVDQAAAVDAPATPRAPAPAPAAPTAGTVGG